MNDAPSQTLLSVGTPSPNGASSPLAEFSYTISTQVEADSSGLIVEAGCGADLDDGTGSGTPDGGVDVNDLLYFLVTFENGNADVDDDGVNPQHPDSGTDVNDLLFFLARFEAGC